MSESDPLLSHDAKPRPLLRDRILNLLRPESPASDSVAPDIGSATNNMRTRDGVGAGHARENQDPQSLPVQSIYREPPICGERRCSHGTFSPRPHHPVDEPFNMSPSREGVFNPNGPAYQPARPADFPTDPSDSTPDSDNVSQMKSSMSASYPKDRKRLYVEAAVSRLSMSEFARWTAQFSLNLYC